VLVCEHRGRWHGEVETFPAEALWLPSGSVGLGVGDHRVEFTDGRFRVRAALPRQGLALDLTFVPTTLPAWVPNVPLEDGPPLQWLLVPRMLASGTVTVEGRPLRLESVPAYHDHNWGVFRWGQDFAWEWGFGLARNLDDPWSCVFVRLTDRARLRARVQALMVWRGGVQYRLLRDQALTVTREGRLGPRRIPRFPRVAGLLTAEGASDVPQRFRVGAREGADHVDLTFEPSSVACVAVPDETALTLTRIHEVNGPLTLRGSLKGEAVRFDGRGFFEFLTP
jgi:hypothetical protein